MLTFSCGRWVNIEIPETLDPTWSAVDRAHYAASMAKALALGYSNPRAAQLAEALTVIMRYPDTSYDSFFMAELVKLRDCEPAAHAPKDLAGTT
jgi:hypothetical protein